MALGPSVPDPPVGAVLRANEKSRQRLGARAVVCARSVLGGLHHEYSLTHADGFSAEHSRDQPQQADGRCHGEHRRQKIAARQ
jgi:hypothetical protein